MTDTFTFTRPVLTASILIFFGVFIFGDHEAIERFANGPVMTAIGTTFTFLLYTVFTFWGFVQGDTRRERLANRAFIVTLLTGMFVVLPLHNGQLSLSDPLIWAMIAAQVVGGVLGMVAVHSRLQRKGSSCFRKP